MKRYLQTRQRGRDVSAGMLADVARFLHARQHLGPAIVVCDDPAATASAAHRQWLKLSRLLQQRRATSGSAEEILRFTSTITHMQHMRFLAVLPQDDPGSHVYFVTAAQLDWVPPHCLTLYVLTATAPQRLAGIIKRLPVGSLVVDYQDQLVPTHELVPKSQLETAVSTSWSEVEAFLAALNIDVDRLAPWHSDSREAFDDALDTLLDVNIEFLQVASRFQRQLDLAQPLGTIPKAIRQRYEAFARLAHRVQVFTPGVYNDQFLKSFVDDTFFLHDRPDTPAWAELLAWHRLAGRQHLVAALLDYAARLPRAQMATSQH